MGKRIRNLIHCSVILAVSLIAWMPAVQAAPPREEGPRCYVNDDADGGNSGGDWANAFTNLQSALTDPGCTEIWVAGGIYKPTNVTNPSVTDRRVSFALMNGVELYGGFAGTEITREPRNWRQNAAILSGDIGAEGDAQDNSFHVVTGSSLDASTVLDGFIIMDGHAEQPISPYEWQWGGGMYISHSDITVQDVVFRHNYAYAGGGMFINEGNPYLVNVTFTQNEAYLNGGGLHTYFEGGTMLPEATSESKSPDARGDGIIIMASEGVRLTGVTFSMNLAGRKGGGMYNIDFGPGGNKIALTNVTFYGNIVENEELVITDGGGMYNENISPTLTNVLFNGNSAIEGGGLLNDFSSPILTNVTFYGNLCPGGGGGAILDRNSSNPKLINSIVWNNEGSPPIAENEITSSLVASYSDIQTNTEPFPGEKNINQDPQFVDAGKGDLRLLSSSPVINKGNQAAEGLSGITADLDGSLRLVGSAVDMGAYEAQAASGVTYVDTDASGPNHDGKSWNTAFINLQAALSAAQGNNQIWVAEGIYYPGWIGNPWSTFQLKSGVALYGGFTGTETNLAQRRWVEHRTVLSGDLDWNDLGDPSVTISDTKQIAGINSFHVVTASGTDASAILDGFTITAGSASGVGDAQNGGGMYSMDGSPTLSNLTFAGNLALNLGGGLFSVNGSRNLYNVKFMYNSARWGGGMCIYGGSAILAMVAFDDNEAVENGGGLFEQQVTGLSLTHVRFLRNSAGISGGGMLNMDAGGVTLTNVEFLSNIATNDSGPTWGGGMYNQDSSPSLTNVVFFDNSAIVGGGLYNDSSSPVLTNVTISGNLCPGGAGGGVTDTNSSHPRLVNSIMWGNQAGFYDNDTSRLDATYSDIEFEMEGYIYPGVGNINKDPLFVDAPGGNLRLQSTSPAIDAGSDAAEGLSGISTDLDGYPRFWDFPGRGSALVDMGAYEFQPRLYLPMIHR
ncbi:MAG: hypothetical protein M1281_15275 [Chloroflexi bacterium]|nr:hypothetical protein [Chloroflexota bacterium]